MYFDTITDDERHIAHPRSALEFHVTYVRIHATPWMSSNVARALPSPHSFCSGALLLTMALQSNSSTVPMGTFRQSIGMPLC